MLTRPDDINNEEYWAYRLKEAEQADNLQYTVYLANKTLWQNIFDAHKKIIEELIPKDAKVLDTGCGYGRMSELFTKEQYTGVDFAPALIEKAQSLYPDKTFVVSKLEELPFKGKGRTKPFDWALCVSVKGMVANKSSKEHWDKMEKDIKRVAKKVLILEYTDPHIYEVL